jgi:hypothetical protein
MSTIAAPPVRWNDRKFHFDPTKPRWLQIVKLTAQIFALLGGLLLALASMLMYPMLLSGTGYAIVYLGPIALVFVTSFFLVAQAWFPADMPAFVRLQMRFGMGLFAAAWFIGVFGIANGYATPIIVQDAPMVYKRTSTPSDPKQISYYVGTRVWQSSRKVYEITVRRDLYLHLDVPVVKAWHIPWQQLHAMPNRGLLRLTVGRGRLGINWLHSVVGVAPSHSK